MLAPLNRRRVHGKCCVSYRCELVDGGEVHLHFRVHFVQGLQPTPRCHQGYHLDARWYSARIREREQSWVWYTLCRPQRGEIYPKYEKNRSTQLTLYM